MSAKACQDLTVLDFLRFEFFSKYIPATNATVAKTWATLTVPTVAVSIRKNSTVKRPRE